MLTITNKRGFITVALKSPYYGRMAFNLCATVKAADQSFPFSIIADKAALSHLSEWQKTIFDNIIDYSNEVDHAVSVKLSLLDFTPYEETIFIDADTAYFPFQKPDELFKDIPESCFFTAITEGRFNFETGEEIKSKRYTYWADLNAIKELYSIDRGVIHQWRTEVMFFRKTEEARSFFSLARDIYKNPRVGYLEFIKGVPDELAVNIAALLSNVEPHSFRWNPSYWVNLYGARIPQANDLIKGKYFILSCGSSGAGSTLKNYYNRIVSGALRKLGRQHIFELLPKREFIKERQAQ